VSLIRRAHKTAITLFGGCVPLSDQDLPRTRPRSYRIRGGRVDLPGGRNGLPVSLCGLAVAQLNPILRNRFFALRCCAASSLGRRTTAFDCLVCLDGMRLKT